MTNKADGTITCSHEFKYSGACVNHGTLQLNGVSAFENVSVLQNDGLMTLDASPKLPGSMKSMQNENRFENLSGGILQIGEGFEFFNWAVLINEGTIINAGDITNQSSLTNKASGEIANAGTLTNSGTFSNEGTLTNESSGSFTNQSPSPTKLAALSPTTVRSRATAAALSPTKGNFTTRGPSALTALSPTAACSSTTGASPARSS